MSRKRIGLLFGAEDTFPWALMNEISSRAAKAGQEIDAGPVKIAHVSQDQSFPEAVILDRISHKVPFYRTYLKCAAARGVQVINNPFWQSADDKFFDHVVALEAGVNVPRTVLLPHKEHPPDTDAATFRNMQFVNWESVFSYLGFPVYLKPAQGGARRDVYRCDDEQAFFSAYDRTRDLPMMAQEAIELADYYRCYVVGRNRVRVMGYDPSQPTHLRYQTAADRQPPPALEERLSRDALGLCEALGYDFNSVEFAVRDGEPFAIDFMNGAPDADVHSVGAPNFDWIVGAVADLLLERATSHLPPSRTGTGRNRLG